MVIKDQQNKSQLSRRNYKDKKVNINEIEKKIDNKNLKI